MKIFNRCEPWPNKVNFIDEQNVVVGYDIEQQCGEHADWFILHEIKTSGYNFHDLVKSRSQYNVESYVFDKCFIKQFCSPHEESDDNNIVIFKLLSNDKDPLFLYLFNHQNGYYGHGFQIKIDDVLTEGML